jgi:tetratricopeptide (TPR) repeat protein
MLAGRLPFAGEYQAAVIYAIINEDPQPVARYNSHISTELERIVSKALAKDREERYQHADDLLADLRRERKNLEYVKTAQVSRGIAVPRSRKKKWPIAVGAATIVAAAALLIFLFSPIKLRVGPAESAQAKENSLAVLYFENLQDPEDKNKTAQMITALLTTGLSDSPRYVQVVSSQRLYDILKLLGKENLKAVDRSVASEVAKKAGVQWMVTGKVLSTEPNIVLISEISNVATGRLLATQRVNGLPGEDLFAVVDQLSPQVAKALTLPEQAQKELEKPVADATTHSQEAYRSYLEGIDNMNRGYSPEAEKNFKKTLEYDPAFAMAYYYLAVIRLHNQQYRQAKDFLSQAMKYAAGMNQKDRLYVEGMADIVSGDFEKGTTAIREVAHLYPDEKEAYFWLGFLYYRILAEPEEAIRCLSRAVAIDPLYKFAYNYLAYAYNDAGDLEKSIWAINQYISLAPDEANPYDSRGDLYAYNGQLDAAIESYQKALTNKPEFLTSLHKIGMLRMFKKEYEEAERVFKELVIAADPELRARSRSALAIIPIYRGKLMQGLAALSDVMAAFRLDHYAGTEIGYDRMNKAEIYDEMGKTNLAIEEVKAGLEALKKADPDAPLWFRDYFVNLLTRKGRMAEAEALVRELRTESEKNWQIRSMYWEAEGELALARNDLKAAQAWFEKDKANSFSLSHTYLQIGALDKAATLLENRLLRYDYDRFYTPILAAKAYYRLGIVYEKSGWRDKAIRNYVEFLDIWKDADPGLPEVADARQRLAKLKKP